MYEKRVEKLFKIAPSFQKVGISGFHPGLQSMVEFCNLMGNPQNRFETIHIAGTNGKGSIAHMLSSALAYVEDGEKIGLYTSPHLVDFRERIKIVTRRDDGTIGYEMIPKEAVISFLDSYDEFINKNEPSFFEITTAMAFDYFAKQGVKAGVIETGLGGRFDSTNVVSSKLSVISSIGYDHKYILGDSISKIAYEKGGIIKPGRAVITGSLSLEAMAQIEKIAAENSSPLIKSTDPQYIKCAESFELAKMDLRSPVQKLNLATVCAVLSELGERYLSTVLENKEVLYNAAKNTGLRGRWELLSESPVVICDIGHNEQALASLSSQLEEVVQGRRIIAIIGMASDKDIQGVSSLYPLNAQYIYTQAQGSRANDAYDLKRIIDDSRKSRGASESSLNSIVTHNVKEAYIELMKIVTPNDVVFVGGSSFVVAEFIPIFEDNKNVTNR